VNGKKKEKRPKLRGGGKSTIPEKSRGKTLNPIKRPSRWSYSTARLVRATRNRRKKEGKEKKRTDINEKEDVR